METTEKNIKNEIIIPDTDSIFLETEILETYLDFIVIFVVLFVFMIFSFIKKILKHYGLISETILNKLDNIVKVFILRFQKLIAKRISKKTNKNLNTTNDDIIDVVLDVCKENERKSNIIDQDNEIKNIDNKKE